MKYSSQIAILIPCLNEEPTIEKVVNDCKSSFEGVDVYVYDNGSTDNSIELAQNAGAIIERHEKKGKGSVFKKMITDIDAEVYIMIDGDDTYPTNSIRRFIDLIKNEKYQMVTGDRISNGEFNKTNSRPFHGIGNRVLTKVINLCSGSNYKDAFSGLRAFSKDLFRNEKITSNGFDIETELSIIAHSKKLKTIEIPIVYRKRPENSFSKLNTIRDGIIVLKAIIFNLIKYKPIRIFSILSALLILTSISIVLANTLFLKLDDINFVVKPLLYLAAISFNIGFMFYYLGNIKNR